MDKKILIVEDEIIIAKDIELKLKSMGYNIIGIAGSYEEVLKIFEKDVPDLLLMDIYIKGEIDGIKVAEIISKNYDIIVIFITADYKDETLENAKLEKSYGYLVKPVKYEDLKSAIEFSFYKHEMNKKILKLEEEKRLKEKIILRQKRFISLGELSALLAHEIRQPLNTIKILTDTLIYIKDKDKDQKDIEILTKISKNIDQVDKIISNVLNTFKKERKIKHENVDLNSTIKDFIFLNSQLFEKENINVKFELDNNIKSVDFYREYFKEILMNFLTNSIKAFKKTNKSEKNIIIKTKLDENKIKIEFIDNATGIKEDIIETIFDPFLVGDKNDKDSTGLGLYVVNYIVTAYNGMVDCFNNEFGGVTFRILLDRIIN